MAEIKERLEPENIPEFRFRSFGVFPELPGGWKYDEYHSRSSGVSHRLAETLIGSGGKKYDTYPTIVGRDSLHDVGIDPLYEGCYGEIIRTKNGKLYICLGGGEHIQTKTISPRQSKHVFNPPTWGTLPKLLSDLLG